MLSRIASNEASRAVTVIYVIPISTANIMLPPYYIVVGYYLSELPSPSGIQNEGWIRVKIGFN